MDDRLLRVDQFIPEKLPMGKSQWWAGVKSGIFPQPIKLGPRTTCWRESDINRLIADGIGANAAK